MVQVMVERGGNLRRRHSLLQPGSQLLSVVARPKRKKLRDSPKAHLAAHGCTLARILGFVSYLLLV
jgi:hypothetical protein